ncbi:MAG: hypothetical protein GTO18_22420 [Anaerolineales bacterium]|nr:hypothetical protein [Anaerolineales bacterium]
MKRKKLLLVTYLIMLGILASQCGPTPTQPSTELENLLVDVFEPQPGEKVLVMYDLPHDGLSDNAGWEERRAMAEEWHDAFEWLGNEVNFEVHPVLTYLATGAHNGPLPDMGEMDGKEVSFEEIVADTNIIVALTEYSASAPLIVFTEEYPDLRAASMPMVSRSMEDTALVADYGEVARKAQILAEKFEGAVGAEVEFTTGDVMYFDLRYREAEKDDGQLHADREGARVINLPSGEVYIATYEGEVDGEPSKTAGTIPVMCNDVLMLVIVDANRITELIGEGACPIGERAFIAQDEALRNIAELGLGVNDKAVVTGNVLEDEKVYGMHWAVGRSDHIGGTVGPEDFSDHRFVIHRDIVHPFGSQVEVVRLALEYADGTSETIIQDGQYTVF